MAHAADASRSATRHPADVAKQDRVAVGIVAVAQADHALRRSRGTQATAHVEHCRASRSSGCRSRRFESRTTPA